MYWPVVHAVAGDATMVFICVNSGHGFAPAGVHVPGAPAVAPVAVGAGGIGVLLHPGIDVFRIGGAGSVCVMPSFGGLLLHPGVGATYGVTVTSVSSSIMSIRPALDR
jgi:hypothetical protein